MTGEDMVLLTSFPVYRSSLDDVTLHNEMQWGTFSSSTYSMQVSRWNFFTPGWSQCFYQAGQLVGGKGGSKQTLKQFSLFLVSLISLAGSYVPDIEKQYNTSCFGKVTFVVIVFISETLIRVTTLDQLGNKPYKLKTLTK